MRLSIGREQISGKGPAPGMKGLACGSLRCRHPTQIFIQPGPTKVVRGERTRIRKKGKCENSRAGDCLCGVPCRLGDIGLSWGWLLCAEKIKYNVERRWSLPLCVKKSVPAELAGRVFQLLDPLHLNSLKFNQRYLKLDPGSRCRKRFQMCTLILFLFSSFLYISHIL